MTRADLEALAKRCESEPASRELDWNILCAIDPLANDANVGTLKGKPRDGYDICHTCDNPACINPNHLWEGTPKDNQHDAIRKGRQNCPKNRKTAQKRAQLVIPLPSPTP